MLLLTHWQDKYLAFGDLDVHLSKIRNRRIIRTGNELSFPDGQALKFCCKMVIWIKITPLSYHLPALKGRNSLAPGNVRFENNARCDPNARMRSTPGYPGGENFTHWFFISGESMRKNPTYHPKTLVHTLRNGKSN